jgi:serine/threonine protein kinase
MSSSTPAPASATQLLCDPQDHYELKKVLGRGSFGAVYVALRKADNVEVAVKRLEVRTKKKRKKANFFRAVFFFFLFSWLRGAFVVCVVLVAIVCGWERVFSAKKRKRRILFFVLA